MSDEQTRLMRAIQIVEERKRIVTGTNDPHERQGWVDDMNAVEEEHENEDPAAFVIGQFALGLELDPQDLRRCSNVAATAYVNTMLKLGRVPFAMTPMGMFLPVSAAGELVGGAFAEGVIVGGVHHELVVKETS